MCINHTRRKKDCTCLTLSLDYFFCCSGIFTELNFLRSHIPDLFLKRNISYHIAVLVWVNGTDFGTMKEEKEFRNYENSEKKSKS